MSRETEVATACQPKAEPRDTPTANDIKAFYATLGFFTTGEWNGTQYEAETG